MKAEQNNQHETRVNCFQTICGTKEQKAEDRRRDHDDFPQSDCKITGIINSFSEGVSSHVKV